VRRVLVDRKLSEHAAEYDKIIAKAQARAQIA
jgi:hypothetical protein